jgi:hypothetical protein
MLPTCEGSVDKLNVKKEVIALEQVTVEGEIIGIEFGKKDVLR